jgi:hypothetical protein
MANKIAERLTKLAMQFATRNGSNGRRDTRILCRKSSVAHDVSTGYILGAVLLLNLFLYNLSVMPRSAPLGGINTMPQVLDELWGCLTTVLGVATLHFLAMCLFTDPGIVDWVSDPATSNNRTSGAERFREELDGAELEQARLVLIDIHTCPSCQVAVFGYDHHCCVIGACIGFRTMPLFLLLTGCCNLTCLSGAAHLTALAMGKVTLLSSPIIQGWIRIVALIVVWLTGTPILLGSLYLWQHYVRAVISGSFTRERRLEMFMVEPGTGILKLKPEFELYNGSMRNIAYVFSALWGLRLAPPKGVVYEHRHQRFHID